MSGIVGIFDRSGRRVDETRLKTMMASLTAAAPDGQSAVLLNNVALAHSLLLTTPQLSLPQQPCTLKNEIWITSDARIDNRKELCRKLDLPGQQRQQLELSDGELILRAYAAWGEDCVQHLVGDFAFGIWDLRHRQLFCARDHLGVRQFYFAYNKHFFIFSNSLDCLRLHPIVSDKINELAIADFLLFGLNQDEASTTFSDIHRLPQAHSLVVSASDLNVRKYWSPSVGSLNFKKNSDYVERFRELLTESVKDRLQTPSAGILMSGGLDSTSVASTARELGRTMLKPLRLHSYCVVYDEIFQDDERLYATAAAESLDIPIEFLRGNVINQTHSERSEGRAPEPFSVDPIYVVSDELLRRISEQARIALTGWDGDIFMSESPKHLFGWLFKRGEVGKLLSSLAEYLYQQKRLPPIGIRTAWRAWRNPGWNDYIFPNWINKDFVQRQKLVERWRAVNQANDTVHPIRPTPFRIINSPSWSALLNRYDPSVTQLPLEVRHPLIDIRVIEFLLALPVIPWVLNKRILREAMRGQLPEKVRLRTKTPLADDPGIQLRYSEKFRKVDSFQPVPALLEYVDREAIPPVSEEIDRNQLWTNLRPFSLNQWLLQITPGESLNEQRPA